MANKPKVRMEWEQRITDPMLTCMVTKAEAMALYEKAGTVIDYAIMRNELSARKSFTGGSWLITMKSLRDLYGEPVNDYLSQLEVESNNV